MFFVDHPSVGTPFLEDRGERHRDFPRKMSIMYPGPIAKHVITEGPIEGPVVFVKEPTFQERM